MGGASAEPGVEQLAAMQRALQHGLAEHLHDSGARVERLRRLPGGASKETWSFDAVDAHGRRGCILRRDPQGGDQDTGDRSGMAPEVEAALQRAAAEAGVPVPGVLFTTSALPDVGHGYAMERVEGETVPRKILRDGAYAKARAHLAADCGRALGQVHAIDCSGLDLPRLPAVDSLAKYRDHYAQFDVARPVLEYAFRWLAERIPADEQACCVHGDFRNGNLIVDADGLRAVLDWELAHIGDPMEDLGWLCIPSWRFGNLEQPVGGFGQRQQLFESYQAQTGRTVDPQRVRFWEALGTLKWGVICLSQYAIFAEGVDRSVDRAAIGRRVSETELDLLELMEGEDG